MINRIFVEKKKGFDTYACSLLDELKESLHLNELEEIRVINRYDVYGLYDEENFDELEFIKLKHNVFSEQSIDMVLDEVLEIGSEYRAFGVEYLPGQFDQRADSAATCVQLITMRERPKVLFAKIILVKGSISDTQFKGIIEYCINPVDSRMAELAKPTDEQAVVNVPKDIEFIEGFINFSRSEIHTFYNEIGFAMSLQDLHFVQKYFKEEEKRDPSITELKVIDTYWSDHCRHTTFLTNITDVKFTQGKYEKLFQREYERYLSLRDEIYDSQRDISLMDLAVFGAKYLKAKGKLRDLDVSEEINACSIKVTAIVDGKEQDWLVMFKNETHNHPTEIEPFGGAATCLGGAIRDPLSGRAYVYQAMRVTGSGDPRVDIGQTLPGKLPQKKISMEAAQGYSSYGNQIGLATGQVREIYHPGYIAKHMEVGAVIGAAPAANVRREKPELGDLIILVGGRTGRDGCGGAAGSSKAHDVSSLENCGAEVQKGNPPVERNLQRLFRRSEASLLIKRCNDFGAGGVSVAVGELADSIDVNLDSVLKKYEGLDGTELAISESQERMAVVVNKQDAAEFIRLSNEENLEAVVIGEVTDSGRFKMFWRGKNILNLSRKFLNTNGLKQEAQAIINTISSENFQLFEGYKDIYYSSEISEESSITARLKQLASEINFASQRGLVDRFDSTIGAGTILMPYGGKFQKSPSLGMAAKLPAIGCDVDTGTLMTYGFDPFLSSKSPFHGGFYAIIESVTKIVAMGGNYQEVRLSLQEYFESLGKVPEKWGIPFAALLGALKAQLDLEIPAIGGKDSMSGSFNDLKVPPTLISFAVSKVEVNNVISTDLKSMNHKLIYVYSKMDDEGIINTKQYKENMQLISAMNRKKIIFSSNVVGKHGIAGAVIEMCVGNRMGLAVSNVSEIELFQQGNGGIIIEVDKEFELYSNLFGGTYKEIGVTIDNGKLSILKDEISIVELSQAYEKTMSQIFPFTTNKVATLPDDAKEMQCFCRSTVTPNVKGIKPKVVIAAFPGTNCETDSKAAFKRAGADVEIAYVKDLDPKTLQESIENLANQISSANIIMIPGGFSGGDEPDGSAKFITAVFRNEKVKAATMDLIDNRGGLMLGICNGFQALIKLGLLPYGKIIDTDENSPTLTYNNNGRHVSRFVNTKVVSVKSPWLSKVFVGDIHAIPVSHGEGKLIANAEILRNMALNGQIVTQYVDSKGLPTMDPEFNPNGSAWAVEGITSADGRIFGKMGHSERTGKGLHKNISGSFNQNLFESAVLYFRG